MELAWQTYYKVKDECIKVLEHLKTSNIDWRHLLEGRVSKAIIPIHKLYTPFNREKNHWKNGKES